MSEPLPNSSTPAPVPAPAGPAWVNVQLATKPVAWVGEVSEPSCVAMKTLAGMGLKLRVLCLTEADEKLVRTVPQVEVIKGAWGEPILQQLCSGAAAVVLFTPVGVQGRLWRSDTHVEDVKSVLQAAEKNELKQIVYLSTLAVCEKSGIECLEAALKAEGLVEGSKMVHYVFRAGPIMGPGDGLISEAVEISKRSSPFMVLWGYGDTKVQPIHAEDLGLCIGRTFVKEPDELRPMIYHLGGKDMLTVLDLLDSTYEQANPSKWLPKMKIHIPIFVLKWASIFNSGKSGNLPSYMERVNLLSAVFIEEKNDTPKLLGSVEKMKSYLQTEAELLAKAS